MEENSVTLLSKELGVPYYNLNKIGVIDWNTDLNDLSHVNMSGGCKVTDFIGNLLVETYGITDHRGEGQEYAAWDTENELYKQKLFGTMRYQTDIKSSLMLCNNSVYTAHLFIKDGIEFDSVIWKLIAQLGTSIQVTTIRGLENAEASTDDVQKPIPASQDHDIRLEVYDAESDSFICAKNWDFQLQKEFVYRN